MWQCKRCGTAIEESFQVCWNCGATIDGTLDPSFQSAKDSASRGPDPTTRPRDLATSLERQLAERFRCAKCKNQGATAKRIAATGTGLSKMFDIQHNHFIAVSCQHCGFTELYDPEILEGKSTLGTVLDVLFG